MSGDSAEEKVFFSLLSFFHFDKRLFSAVIGYNLVWPRIIKKKKVKDIFLNFLVESDHAMN